MIVVTDKGIDEFADKIAEKVSEKVADKINMNNVEVADVGFTGLAACLSAILIIPVIYYFIDKNLKRQN